MYQKFNFQKCVVYFAVLCVSLQKGELVEVEYKRKEKRRKKPLQVTPLYFSFLFFSCILNLYVTQVLHIPLDVFFLIGEELFSFFTPSLVAFPLPFLSSSPPSKERVPCTTTFVYQLQPTTPNKQQ